jgi:spermidine dehydrogenase
MNLDLPVSIGGYACSQRPDEPIVVHMMKTPVNRDDGLASIIFWAGWNSTTQPLKPQSAISGAVRQSVGPGGFDPANDITAITVNRWSHGSAYEYNSLWDKFWLEGGEMPCEVARQPFARIAIANADTGAYVYTDCRSITPIGQWERLRTRCPRTEIREMTTNNWS